MIPGSIPALFAGPEMQAPERKPSARVAIDMAHAPWRSIALTRPLYSSGKVPI